MTTQRMSFTLSIPLFTPETSGRTGNPPSARAQTGPITVGISSPAENVFLHENLYNNYKSSDKWKMPFV